MNILNALFMVVAALLAMLLLRAGMTIPQIFLVTALLDAVVAIGLFSSMPECVTRFVAWMTGRRWSCSWPQYPPLLCSGGRFSAGSYIRAASCAARRKSAVLQTDSLARPSSQAR